jgi:hypothetical protein
MGALSGGGHRLGSVTSMRTEPSAAEIQAESAETTEVTR